MLPRFTRMRRAAALLTFVSAIGVAAGSPAQGSSSLPKSVAKSDVVALACDVAAPQPFRSGVDVRAGVYISDCGGNASWKLTLQRHRFGPWWQSESTNTQTGDGELTVAAGCVSGTHTYRTILEQTNGARNSVSATIDLGC
jgi:hypothetical protein